MFYDKFVKICNARGISPSRAAIEAGLSKSTVTKWKTTPSAEPTGSALRKLSEYFEISISELLAGETKKSPTVSSERKINLQDVDVGFYGDFVELSEDDKETVRDMVRLMRQRRAAQQEK